MPGYFSGFAQDLRYGLRTLRRNPTFTTVAMLTLALGIGANSAVFSLINAALLRPLPFPDPDRLVLVWEDTSMFGVKDSPAALGNYTEWRARSQVFQEIGALEQRGFRLSGTGDPQQLRGSAVTASLLRTLGVQPALGRLFRDEEDQPGQPKTVLLSHGLWQREFAADPRVVGRTIDVNDDKYMVVGIMPPGFRFPDTTNQLWVPTGASLRTGEFTNKGRHNWMVVGRLKPGVALARANQEMHIVARRLEAEFPETNARVGAFVAPLRDHFVADVRTMLLVLGGAVGFVLLIACSNIANLLLSRASNRRREVAIRAAIGASRGRVVRQLLTENLLLSAGGALGGLVIATLGVKFLARLLPAGIAAMSAVTVDLRVLVFTFAISLLTGIVFGLVPAFELLRVDLQHVLKQGGGRGSTVSSRGVRSVLVIAEVALSFVLMMGAALFLQSFAHLRGTDPGFASTHVLTAKTPMSGRRYSDPANRTAFYRQAVNRLQALPGVVSVGFANQLPLMRGNVNGFTVEGQPRLSEGSFSNANFRVVSQDYLQTIGVPLRRGRYLNLHDTETSAPVALINEAMKRKFWPTEDALGKRLRFADPLPWISVVGIVGDIKQSGLDKASSPELYLPSTQNPTPLNALALRTKVDPKSLAAAVRREIRAVDPGMPIGDLSSMEELLDLEVFQRRVQTLLLSTFAAIALLLAFIGIYGVLSYLVAQRTQEIGVRMALGASPRDLLFSVAGQGFALSVAGVALGAAGALALGRLVSKVLYGVGANDPATLLVVAVLLLSIASAAAYAPARRAMKVDPILALREE